MPFPVYKNWVGAAKMNTGFAFLTAATVAGATSIPISNTSVPASSTIFFVDGTNSESVAVSAGGGTQTLTTAATANAHAANCIIYAQLTASLGPTDYVPTLASELDFSDDIPQLHDEGIRGSNVKTYGSFPGPTRGMWKVGGPLMADTVGWAMGSIFGAVDFAGGTPNTHTFASNNVGSGQPTGLLWYYNNGNNTRCFSNAKADEFTLKLDPKQNITYTCKGIANQSIVVGNPTLSYGILSPQAAWQVTGTIAGTVIPQVNLFDATWKRPVEAIPTLQGVQSPYQIFSGALEVTGNIKFIMENDVQLLQFLNNTQPSVVMAFTNGVGAAQVGITVTITKTNFETGFKMLPSGGTYIEVGGTYAGISTTTDGNVAGTGYSPGRIALKNNVATGHYQ